MGRWGREEEGGKEGEEVLFGRRGRRSYSNQNLIAPCASSKARRGHGPGRANKHDEDADMHGVTHEVGARRHIATSRCAIPPTYFSLCSSNRFLFFFSFRFIVTLPAPSSHAAARRRNQEGRVCASCFAARRDSVTQ